MSNHYPCEALGWMDGWFGWLLADSTDGRTLARATLTELANNSFNEIRVPSVA